MLSMWECEYVGMLVICGQRRRGKGSTRGSYFDPFVMDRSKGPSNQSAKV